MLEAYDKEALDLSILGWIYSRMDNPEELLEAYEKEGLDLSIYLSVSIYLSILGWITLRSCWRLMRRRVWTRAHTTGTQIRGSLEPVNMEVEKAKIRVISKIIIHLYQYCDSKQHISSSNFLLFRS